MLNLYKTYREAVAAIGKPELAWFTTFNLDPYLAERFLFSLLGGSHPSALQTIEDYEVLNRELEQIDLKVWYDYRALNLNSSKRTIAQFVPVDTKQVYHSASSGAIFHPKVILLIGTKAAYLICGSANLSVSAWSSNCEAIIARKVTARKNARQLVEFFKGFAKDTAALEYWAETIKQRETDWDFLGTHKDNNVFSKELVSRPGPITIWTPYFSKDVYGLCEKYYEQGATKIEFVPDIDVNGRIRVPKDRLAALINERRVGFLRRNNITDEREAGRFHHAKVWLTPDKIAVGSWNFSRRATGLGLPVADEQNFEAGVVVKSSAAVFEELKANLADYTKTSIVGVDPEELDKEWEKVLEPYTFSCQLVADWKTFTYALSPEAAATAYFVALPDQPEIRVPISAVAGRTFRGGYLRVLKNKSFTVHNAAGDRVFYGYLSEINCPARPVYCYSNLSDLIDAIVDDSDAASAKKRLLAPQDSEDQPDAEEQYTSFFNEARPPESFYKMFVAFEKLYQNIAKADAKNLDALAFRRPDSLVNISTLVLASLEKALKDGNQDSLVFHWFLVKEANRSLAAFNKILGEEKIPLIPDAAIKDKLPLSNQDKAFITRLGREFSYVKD